MSKFDINSIGNNLIKVEGNIIFKLHIMTSIKCLRWYNDKAYYTN